MQDEHKTKSELIAELATLRERLGQLQTAPLEGGGPEAARGNVARKAQPDVEQPIPRRRSRKLRRGSAPPSRVCPSISSCWARMAGM